MNSLPRVMRTVLIALLLLGAVVASAAESAKELAARQKLAEVILARPEDQAKLLGELADTGSKTAHDVLNAWTRGGVYLYVAPGGAKVPVLLEDQQDGKGKARAVSVADGQFLKDDKGVELRFDANALNAADTDMALRRVIQRTMDSLALSDQDPDTRRSAVSKLGNSQRLQYIPLLQARLDKETDASVRRAIVEAMSLLRLADPDPAVETEAINQLARLQAIGAVQNLQRFAARENCPPGAKAAAASAIRSIESHIWWVNFYGTIFHGISLGSILLVVALGLAITFGLMGIINMAHGEMIAVGAYTCYVVQNLFGAGFGFTIVLPIYFGANPIQFGMHLPGMNATGWVYECYFLIALPLSFIMAALAGLLVERTVIRFLYRRPLESLLATWGVSLVMQQCFRMVFGANNVQVNSPSWLLGHFSIDDVSFGYNRVFVICFAIVIVIGTWLLLAKTPLGLLIRAVMQNRNMAACLGVRTRRINMLTFAFGSGLAGLAGAFLSQIGNVGPSLGQTYIVDSFMTVVVGGVGSIVGTVCAALGIGTSDQVLQQLTGSPVSGKIVVLITIILFLQWKPGGLFSIRSRSLD
jgi:urea transport system permease protein